jgi:hypothetical protein
MVRSVFTVGLGWVGCYGVEGHITGVFLQHFKISFSISWWAFLRVHHAGYVQ